MSSVKVDKRLFNFKYLPAYADYLLKNKLEEFVTVGIRYYKEYDLPLMKPLAKLSEAELVALSMESNKLTLTALKEDKIANHIEINLNNWITNKLNVIDKFEIAVEDLTLAFFLKRKLFAYFLYGYNQSAPIQQLITSEVDLYTSMEELIVLKVFFDMQAEKFNSKR